jgi:Ca2+-binding RTX toxin-like protein
MKTLALWIGLTSGSLAVLVLLPASASGQATGLCLDETPTIVGTEGNDVLAGMPGARNVIASLGGDDVVTGADGVDVICGGNGNDQLNGSLGNDQFDGGAGDDTMAGGEGRDVVFFTDAPGGVTVNLITFSAVGFGTDSLTGVEDAVGSLFDDAFIGDGAANFFDGRGGNDAFSGGPGRDIFDGDAGNDFFDGGPGLDLVTYFFAPRGITANLSKKVGSGWGTDRFTLVEDLGGSRFRDILTGNARANGLFGLGGNDRLNGLSGADFLFGNAGRDRLDGGRGRDLGNGGPGIDTCINVERRRKCP